MVRGRVRGFIIRGCRRLQARVLRGFETVDPLCRDGTGTTGGGLGSEYVHPGNSGNGDAGGGKNAHEPLVESLSSAFGFGFHNTQRRQPQWSSYITPNNLNLVLVHHHHIIHLMLLQWKLISFPLPPQPPLLRPHPRRHLHHRSQL
ncbi:hypothetical protein GYMLUDRAFT_594242 [Collybiopsis luxurians FD-317 M1]|uniref:Uncharacterized protein n=1 Tax=Collybiopsis luxurians FD-317 M1 TaxID=944289 RepID=A0A0D0CPE7_9AGAR|nr:hypothetical protein GYMLUDRAFT_594242 [Collybiopsis luxurians FD-317 M1]